MGGSSAMATIADANGDGGGGDAKEEHKESPSSMPPKSNSKEGLKLTSTPSTTPSRNTLRTPKSGRSHMSQKTWSHSMDNFKSVKRKKKKEMSEEEKKRMRQKRRQKDKDRKGKGGGKEEKSRGPRASVKNPLSNLGGSSKQIDSRSSIKMVRPNVKMAVQTT